MSRFGGPDVLELVEDLPSPVPGAGELLVDVAVAGVGWLDTRIRLGQAPSVFEVTLPFVPGSAVAGQVSAVGPGVDRGWLGAMVVRARSAATAVDMQIPSSLRWTRLS